MKTKVLYEDSALIVAYKPSGLATQSAGIGQKDMVSEIKNYLAVKDPSKKGNPYVGLIHRLDQPVEGLLVFAKTKEAANKLNRQLEHGELKKKYLAVLSGSLPYPEGKREDYLDKGKDQRAFVVDPKLAENTQAKHAILEYRLLDKKTEPEEFSLVEISIETGRFHQIRVQMAHMGNPLLGDEKYGDGKTKEISRKLGISTVALCAFAVTFKHPFTGKKMSFSVPPQNKAFSFFSIPLV